MPGGAHENMRGWSPEEDELLLQLIQNSGKRWKLIAEALGTHPNGTPRTPAMVRNRYLRIERGRWLTERGMSKNRCGQCGQLKRGHVCQAPRALVNTSFQAQEARHEASRLALPYDPQMGASSIGVIESASPYLSAVFSSDSPRSADGGLQGEGAAPPMLRPQCSMELLLQATEMQASSAPAAAEPALLLLSTMPSEPVDELGAASTSDVTREGTLAGASQTDSGEPHVALLPQGAGISGAVPADPDSRAPSMPFDAPALAAAAASQLHAAKFGMLYERGLTDVGSQGSSLSMES